MFNTPRQSLTKASGGKLRARSAKGSEGASPEWRSWRLPQLQDLTVRQETAKAEKDALVKAAADREKARAEKLRNDALRIFEQAREAGRQRGYSEGAEKGSASGYGVGYKEGREQGIADSLREQEALATAFAGLIRSTSSSLGNLNEEIGTAVLKMAARVAGYVINREVAHNPDQALLDALKSVLSTKGEDFAILTLRMNPDQCKIASEYLSNHPLLDRSELRILADESLTPGDVFAETAFGEIDATLGSRWDAALATLGGIADDVRLKPRSRSARPDSGAVDQSSSKSVKASKPALPVPSSPAKRTTKARGGK